MEEMINIEEVIHLELYFPPEIVQKPLLHIICHKNNVEYNIEKAQVDQSGGHVLLNIGGRETDLMKAIEEFLYAGIRFQHKI